MSVFLNVCCCCCCFFLQAGTHPQRRMAKTDSCLSCTGTTCLRFLFLSFHSPCDQYIYIYFFFCPANHSVLYMRVWTPNQIPHSATTPILAHNTDTHAPTWNLHPSSSATRKGVFSSNIYLSVHLLSFTSSFFLFFFFIATFIPYSRKTMD